MGVPAVGTIVDINARLLYSSVDRTLLVLMDEVTAAFKHRPLSIGILPLTSARAPEAAHAKIVHPIVPFAGLLATPHDELELHKACIASFADHRIGD